MSKFNTELQIQIEYTYFMRVKKRNPTRFPSQNVRTTWDDIENTQNNNKDISIHWVQLVNLLSKKMVNYYGSHFEQTWCRYLTLESKKGHRIGKRENRISLMQLSNWKVTTTLKQHQHSKNIPSHGNFYVQNLVNRKLDVLIFSS